MLRAGSCLWNETFAVFGGGAFCHLRAPRSHRERACRTPKSVSIQRAFCHTFPCVPAAPKSPASADRRPLRGAHRQLRAGNRGFAADRSMVTAALSRNSSGRFTKGHYAPWALAVSLRPAVIVTPDSLIKESAALRLQRETTMRSLEP